MSDNNNCRLYVGHVSEAVQSRDIDLLFRSCGVITDIEIKKGYAFIEFSCSKDARRAMIDMNGASLFGQRIILQPAHPNPRFRSSHPESGEHRSWHTERFQAVIRNLSTRVEWQELKRTIHQVVPVKFVDAHFYKPREGIVEFYNKADMKTAIAHFDGHEYYGRKMEMFAKELELSASSSCSSCESDFPVRGRSPERSRKRHHSHRSLSESSRSRSRSRFERLRDGRHEKENFERRNSREVRDVRKLPEKDNRKTNSRNPHSETDKTTNNSNERHADAPSRKGRR